MNENDIDFCKQLLLCVPCIFANSQSTIAQQFPSLTCLVWSYQFWSIVTSPGSGTTAVYETCHRYPQNMYQDSNWKASRAFATLSIIVGGIALFTNLISACVSPLRKTSRYECGVFIITAFFQGMSLLLLNSYLCNGEDNLLLQQMKDGLGNMGNNDLDFQETCSISTGAKCTIAAMVFWLVAGILSRLSFINNKKEEEEGCSNPNTATEPLILSGENL